MLAYANTSEKSQSPKLLLCKHLRPIWHYFTRISAQPQAPTPTSVPEPASLLGLMVVGILGAGCVLKRGHATC
ncbi:MAG: PEP-CTERM sorting domain-containing protein [Merismopedia sp. SIO2A8]|nr:PEP-CTERM sorting domain-containing protein [Symploca sp. SIO2B6]NET47362.1 PEP-CTERM sorting domain-containing protein [Merismopedia sp. SIO2A8]